MKDIKKMKDKELIKEYKSMFASVYVYECYGVSDMAYLLAIGKELMNRGYAIDEEGKLSITKKC